MEIDKKSIVVRKHGGFRRNTSTSSGSSKSGGISGLLIPLIIIALLGAIAYSNYGRWFGGKRSDRATVQSYTLVGNTTSVYFETGGKKFLSETNRGQQYLTCTLHFSNGTTENIVLGPQFTPDLGKYEPLSIEGMTFSRVLDNPTTNLARPITVSVKTW